MFTLLDAVIKIAMQDQASSKLKSVSNAMGKGLATAAKVGVAAVGAAATAVGVLGKIGLDYNMQMETYTTNFETMLGSNEAAVAKVAELKEFASKTPLSMDDLAKGTQTLLAFGVASEDSTNILRQLGDIALGNADKMQRLATAFGKANAQGKLTGETVQQMIDAGWNPLIEIAEMTGESMDKVRDRMSKGKISVEELKAAMAKATSEGGKFAGGMEKASHTTAGLISTLKDNVNALIGDVFMPISDGLLNDVLPTAIDSVAKLTNAFKTGGVDGMIDAAGEILETLVKMITEALPTIMTVSGKILVAIGNGILSNLPLLITTAFDLVTQFTQALADNADETIEGALQIILAITDGLMTNAPLLLGAFGNLLGQLAISIIEHIPEIFTAFAELITAILTGLQAAVDSFGEVVRAWLDRMLAVISEKWAEFLEAGDQVVQAIMEGIKGAWDGLVSWFNGIWDSLFGNRSVNVDVNASGGGSGHAGGLDFVPYNEYPANLHRGEAVLTAAEADAWRNGRNAAVQNQTVKEVTIPITLDIDGTILAKKLYKHNLNEDVFHGDALINSGMSRRVIGNMG